MFAVPISLCPFSACSDTHIRPEQKAVDHHDARGEDPKDAQKARLRATANLVRSQSRVLDALESRTSAGGDEEQAEEETERVVPSARV